MSKKLLFLYPIEEYWKFNFCFTDFENKLQLLEETIDCRYRQKGYEIYYLVIADREVSCLHVLPEDHVLVDEGSHIEKFVYPNQSQLISALGETEHLVVGGFHANDCVKRIAQAGIDNGLDTLVDIELTNHFPSYSSKFYFKKEEYNLANHILAGMYEVNKYSPKFIDRCEKYAEVYYHRNDFVPTITIEDVERNEQIEDEEFFFPK